MSCAILAAADVRGLGALKIRPEALAARTDSYLSPAAVTHDPPRNPTVACGRNSMRERAARLTCSRRLPPNASGAYGEALARSSAMYGRCHMQRSILFFAILLVIAAAGCSNGSSKPSDSGDAGGHGGLGGATSVSMCDPGCDYVCQASLGCDCVCSNAAGGSTS